MISFPSSLQSSVFEDKENVNPNRQKSKAPRISPQSIKKGGVSIMNAHQLFEADDSANYGTQQQESCQNTNNSLHALFKGLNSPTEEPQIKEQPGSLINLVKEVLCSQELSTRQVIQICEQYHIYNRQDIGKSCKSVEELLKHRSKNNIKTHNMKQMLGTDLGHLKVEEVCHKIGREEVLTEEQQRIVSFLMKDNCEDKITKHVLRREFEFMKEELSYELNQMKKLQQQFLFLQTNKIHPLLESPHFRLQLTSSITTHSFANQLTYPSLSKVLAKYLTDQQISLIFRCIYALQTDGLMPILDPTKRISSSLLLRNLFRKSQICHRSSNLQQRTDKYNDKEKHAMISQLQQSNKLYLQELNKKDKEIEKLNGIIEMIAIENEQKLKLDGERSAIQMAALKRKYEQKIASLEESQKDQTKMTQWYQHELQAIITQVNKENVMRKLLTNNAI